MKKRIQNILIIIAVIASDIIIAGCINPLEDTIDNTMPRGMLVFSLDETSDSRTISPVSDLKSLVDSYSVYFSNHSEGQPDFTVDSYIEGSKIIDIYTGSWDITLNGLDGEGNIICTGLPESGNPVLITEGDNSLSITVDRIAGSGFGILDYTISFPPEDVDSVTITVDPWPIGGGDDYELDAGVDYNSDFTAEGELAVNCSLQSGQYCLTVTLGNDPGAPDLPVEYPPLVEIVQIFNNLTSSSSLEISAEDLTQPPEPPSDFSEAQESDLSFILFWDDESSDEDGFRIYEGSVDGVPEAEVEAGVTTITSAELGFTEYSEGDTYTFYIVSYNRFGESEPAGLTFSSGYSFVSTWQTDNEGVSEDNQITLPLVSNGTYDFSIYWGDGSTSEITSYDDTDVTHTYTEAGCYTLRIYGEISGWSFSPEASYSSFGDAEKILEISSWGPFAFGDTKGQFYHARNLDITAKDVPDTSDVTSFNNAFYFNFALSSIHRMNEWDTSNVTDMTDMFYLARKFNEDISNWNTSKVTSMRGLFYAATVFNQDISKWDTSSVTDMGYMFCAADSFNQDLGGWDTSKVTDMRYMLYSSDFDQNIADWDVSQVTSFKKFLDNAKLSTDNYDALLKSWAVQPVKTGCYFSGGYSKFRSDAEWARAVLIETYGWKITDSGLAY